MILGEVEYTVVFDAATGAPAAEGAPGAVARRLDPSEVEPAGGGYVLKADRSVKVAARAHKMSKSRGNVVNPDDVVAAWGADSLRLYEMFMGPLRDVKTWSPRGVEGVHRFLARVYRLIANAGAEGAPALTDAEPTKEQARALAVAIARVTEETEALRFNTAISAMMEFVNAAYKWESRPRAALAPFVLLLAPYAPHLAEEMWQALGAGPPGESLAYAPWPVADAALLVADAVTLAVQVNGKTRGAVELPVGADEAAALAAAAALPAVARQLEGKAVRKVIYREGKILNLVVG
jgi:leucyl-tRNA synthetase